MPSRRDRLFAEQDLADVLRATTQSIPKRVNQVGKDQFLASSDEQLVEHFFSELSVEHLVLHEDQRQMEQQETEVDVSGDFDRGLDDDLGGPKLIPGTRVTVTIPFTGDAELWKCKPNPCHFSFPLGKAIPPRRGECGYVVFTIEQAHDRPEEQFKQALDKFLNDTRDHIENQTRQIEAFNANLPKHIQQAATARRERLKRHEGLSQVLDIPLKPREGVPSIEPIRIEKKITKPLPPPPKSGFKPEPGITKELYEAILNITRHEGRTFETTPKTYAKLEEEELRDILLAHLNGHFEGGATGETFRKLGKTDIRIEDEERAAFVAECKVWRGQQELGEAVNQLIGYLTWRDCKAALVVFNKEVAGFTQLLEKLPEALCTHPFFIKDLGQQGDGEWRFVFRSEEDENRLITVHVFLFNLYTK